MKKKISLNRLKGLSVCKICGEFIIYDAWCGECHMNHYHPEIDLTDLDWFENNFRTASGDDLILIIRDNYFIEKQVKKNCECKYCKWTREYNKKRTTKVENK